MQILTERLILREFREADFAEFRAWDADPEVQRFELARPATEMESRKMFAGILLTQQEDPRMRWPLAVTRRVDGRLVGRVTLSVFTTSPASSNPRIFEIGWTVDPRFWGQGIATEAASGLLRLAFTQLNAHRVLAFCNASNRASSRVMEKLGMQPEAHFREALWQHERWWDELCYAILEREYTG